MVFFSGREHSLRARNSDNRTLPPFQSLSGRTACRLRGLGSLQTSLNLGPAREPDANLMRLLVPTEEQIAGRVPNMPIGHELAVPVPPF